MTDAMHVFDRGAVRYHRDRAAANPARHDFLFREVAARLMERLDEVDRKFARVLDLGCRHGTMSRDLRARAGVDLVIGCDLSAAMLRHAEGPAIAADEEALPFAPHAFDLACGALGLHWVNDLPGALIQLRRALRPDGLLLMAMLGGNTLHEMRRALIEAEAEIENGASPRVSPFVELRDAGALLQRAGFALPVVDVDTITVTWPDAFALMRDLRGMGEANAVRERRRKFTRRETLFTAARRYQELFADGDGRIPATFQVLYLTAWAPDDSQQKPLRPGSAAARLADALEAEEKPAGEKAVPDD